MTTHYFSPGPASLPKEVLSQIHAELLDTFGIGVSVMEISHRSSQYEEINKKTLELAREVFQVPDSHAVIFSSCGAQQHFSLLIEHLSAAGDDIAYTDTGVWAHLACEEAKNSGRKVHVIYNGAPSYASLANAEHWQIPAQCKFIHLTVNNTVYGTEYPTIPSFNDIPLVLDMTSALGARTDIPWDKTALVYASAQKNFGIAGVSVLIMHKEYLERSKHFTKLNHLGRALSYHALFEANSALNTPPVMAIFVMGKMLQWIKDCGGIVEMEKLALQKSALIYQHFDDNFYIGRAAKEFRSRHNCVFNLPTPEHDADFIAEAAKENILEIKGYKLLKGIRISMYNDVSLQSAELMSKFIQEYRSRVKFH